MELHRCHRQPLFNEERDGNVPFSIMGLFSSSTVYSVSTSKTPLMDASDALPTNILGAVLTETSLTSAILTALSTSYRIKSEKLYHYCKDEYYYGLPEGTAIGDTSIGANIDAITDILEAKEGGAVSVVIAASGEIVTDLYMTDFKENTLQLDELTGEMYGYTHPTISFTMYFVSSEYSSESSIQVNMYYMDEVIVEEVDEEGTVTYVTTYERVDIAVQFGIPSISASRAYYSVQYTVTATSETKYWFYLIGSNIHPSIEASTSSVADSVFMPIVSIKNNKSDIRDSTNTALKETTEVATKIVGFDLGTITDAINDTDENPDANLIDDAFIAYTLDINTESQVGINYLYDFFDLMDQNIKIGDKTDYDQYVLNGGRYIICKPTGDGGESCITYEMPYKLNILNVTDGQFNTRIGWNYIDKVLTTGSVGPIGTTTVERTILPNLRFWLKGIYSPSNPSGYVKKRSLEQSYIVLRRQLTSNSYIEMTVHGLEHATDIDGRGIITQTLETSVDNSLFYLPVAHSLIERMDSISAEEFYRETVGLIVYAIKGTKLDWYESPKFMFIVRVVIVAVSIALAQPQLAAINLSTTAGILTLVQSVALNYLLVKTAEVIIKELGFDTALVTALLSAASAVYLGFSGGTLFTLTPDMLLDLTLIITTASDNVVQAESANLLEEQEDFLKTVEEKEEEFQKVRDTLDTPDDYLLDTVTRASLHSSMTLDSFYSAAIGIEITDVIIGSVTGYVDNALELPRTI